MTADARLIFKEVCKTLNIPEEQVISKSRIRAVVEARFISVYFIKLKYPGISLNVIGQWFNKNNNGAAHSFACYGIKQTLLLYDVSNEFKKKYTLCLNALKFYDQEINF